MHSQLCINYCFPNLLPLFLFLHFFLFICVFSFHLKKISLYCNKMFSYFGHLFLTTLYAYFGLTCRFIRNAPGIRHRIALVNSILLAALRTGPLPKHVAFIMDGNRRFAKHKKIPVEGGHSVGAARLVKVSSVIMYKTGASIFFCHCYYYYCY